jgi:hypothetical protein
MVTNELVIAYWAVGWSAVCGVLAIDWMAFACGSVVNVITLNFTLRRWNWGRPCLYIGVKWWGAVRIWKIYYGYEPGCDVY